MTRTLALLLILLCAMPALHATEAGPADWLARYRVVFGETEAGLPAADVEGALKWVAEDRDCPKVVDIDMADDQFPKGYGSFVRGFQSILPDGAPASGTPAAAESLSPPAGRYRLHPLKGCSASFRYKVVMEHDAADWGPGPDEAPYRFEGGAFWTGRALFITAPRSRVEVTLLAPEGREVSVSFTPIARRAGSYTVPGEQRLRDSFLVVGTYRTMQMKVGSAVVELVLGGRLAESMPVVGGAVRRFLKASGSVFEGAPPARILVVGNLGAPRGSLMGGGFADDLSFLTDVPWEASNADRWRPFLCHEIFHLWNGNAISFGEKQQYWFSEGVTEYYAHLLPVRLGEVRRERFFAVVKQKWTSYLKAAGSTGLLEAGDEKFKNNALIYDGGTLAALILDLKIREATSNRRSLDDLLKALYAWTQEPEHKDVTLDQIVRAVEEVSGHPMDDFFKRSIQGQEGLPLGDALKIAGIRLHTEVTKAPDLDFVLQQMLHCPSVTRVPGGLVVNVSDSDRILAGDIIVGLPGSPIDSFDDLRKAFRGREPASQASLLVIREGKTVTLDVVLGGKAGDVVPQSSLAETVLDLMPDADPMALKIRKSIFGIR